MKTLYLSILSCFLAATSLFAIKTGDAALDESLNTLNEQVKDAPEKFIETNLGLRFNQPKSKLIDMLKKDKLEVAEIFIISYLSAKNNAKLEDVLEEVKESKNNWELFLKSRNIKKGSKEYRNLLKASINIHPKPFMPKVK
jgi:hypothetical protein